MPILFGIVAALGWGLADFFARFATRRVGTFRTLLFMQVAGIAGLLIWLGFAPRSVLAVPLPHAASFWIWAVVSTVLNTLASLAFYRALETGLLTVVAPVCSAYPVVTVLVSMSLGEKLNLPHLSGILVATLGVILAVTSFASPPNALSEDTEPASQAKPAIHPMRGVGLAMMASLMFGANFVVIAYRIVPFLGGIDSVLLLRALSVGFLLLISVPAGQSIALTRSSVWMIVAVVGVLDTLGFVASNLGLATGHVSVVTVLCSLFGAVTVFLGWVFLRERIDKSQWFGIFLIFLGIILVSI